MLKPLKLIGALMTVLVLAAAGPAIPFAIAQTQTSAPGKPLPPGTPAPASAPSR